MWRGKGLFYLAVYTKGSQGKNSSQEFRGRNWNWRHGGMNIAIHCSACFLIPTRTLCSFFSFIILFKSFSSSRFFHIEICRAHFRSFAYLDLSLFLFHHKYKSNIFFLAIFSNHLSHNNNINLIYYLDLFYN